MISVVNEFLDDLRGGRMTESPIVRVEEGELQGKLVNSPSGKAFYSFQGIPYAKPPIGSLRFKAPQPPEPWDGVREATSEGNSCAQIEPFFHKEYLGDENCLFLNVYTPSVDGEFLPVMVYIHGGGFRMGSSSTSLFGADYLVEKDVVIVTINYRCGPLGFLCLNTPDVPGNAGAKDIVQALRWVKENIKNFGGNSGNLTVFGKSCGSALVTLLTASPLTKNLINKAIIQSGTALNTWAIQRSPIENATALAKELGCESIAIDEIYEFLSTTPVKDIVEAYERMSPLVGTMDKKLNPFAPVVEKEFPGVEAFLTEPFVDVLTSGRVADIPVMIGSTAVEVALVHDTDDLQSYIPKDLNIERNSDEALAIAEKIKALYFKGDVSSDKSLNDRAHLVSDCLYNINMHRYIKYLVNNSNKPIYFYKFDYNGELDWSNHFLKSLDLKRAGHVDEVGYLFKNDLEKEVEPQDVKMRERLLRLWTNFAKGGNPTPDENHYLPVTWLPVTEDKLCYLNIGNELSLATNPDQEKMEFWDKLYGKYYKIWDHPATNESIVPICERIEFSTAPVIVEETIITTSTVVNNVETTETQVLVNVQETVELNEEIKGLIVDDNEAVHQNNVVDVPTEEIAVPDNVLDSHTPDNLVQEEVEPTEVQVVEHSEDFGINIVEIQQKFETPQNGVEEIKFNGNSEKKPRPSNEIKMVPSNNVNPKDVIRANDPPEDDLPKNIGVNKFVNFFESLGGKK
ncbi:juvenile hormone esterase-like isoform X1 [Vanessa tameamea]|uniref:Juvenile hormone esterase-like isoform X1 n=2 Tax=Vanessa tameamea TaxID=334116 RepID=A0A8B8HF89_VANTA